MSRPQWPQAGWYDDAFSKGRRQRYWTGAQWGEVTRASWWRRRSTPIVLDGWQ